MPRVPKRSSPVTTAGSEINAAAQRVTKQQQTTSPVWEGPAGPGPNGGITQSMLGRYLVCPERFRAQYVEGWHPADRFNARTEYGHLWHRCEEAEAAGRATPLDNWAFRMREYADGLCRRYMTDREEIGLWAEKCHALFPRYVQYWRDHPDRVAREPLLQEHVFDVPYRLPSGRTIRLRGKWDSVDLIREGENAGVWLQENKTKSAVDATKVGRQVKFDLQTMMYHVALDSYKDFCRRLSPNQSGDPRITLGTGKYPIRGVRYNVVRRAAHKTVESMLKKLDEDVRNRRAGEWFTRFNVEVRPADVVKFHNTCLDPLLENLLDDYEWWTHCVTTSVSPFDHRDRYALFVSGRVGALYGVPHQRRHFVMPYGVYSPLTEGGSADLDEYVHTKSTAGLRRVTDLFEELR